jgi:hypothetical protein
VIEAAILLSGLLLAFVALYRWRTALLLCLPYALLADMGRKAIEGQPVYLSALVIVPFAASMVGAHRAGIPWSLKPLFRYGPALKIPLLLYVILVVLQSLHAALSTGSAIVAGIGLIAYLAPVLGVLLGYHYARSVPHVRRFLRWYVGFVVLATLGVYLARLGVGWEILQSVGPGLVAYSPSGQPLDLETGFFRAAEVAAWHTAMAICFLFLFVFGRRKVLASVALVPWLLPLLAGALVLTGRRKGIVEVGLFLLVYLACLAYFRRGAVKTAVVLALVAVAGLVWFAASSVDQNLAIAPYLERGVNIGSEDVGRIEDRSLTALRAVIARNGFFGSGAGTGSQGAQYFGAGAELVGKAAEGGMAKILAELGVPGLFLVVWLGIGYMIAFWKVVRASSTGGAVPAHFAYGFLGFLFANTLTFTIGHQVFGDPLVLMVLGLVAGFLLRMPSLAGAGLVRRRPRRRRRGRARGRRFPVPLAPHALTPR